MVPHTLIVTVLTFVQPPVSTSGNALDARMPEVHTEYIIEQHKSLKACEAARAKYEAPGYFLNRGSVNATVSAGGECVPGKVNKNLI